MSEVSSLVIDIYLPLSSSNFIFAIDFYQVKVGVKIPIEKLCDSGFPNYQ